jgi:uncharacterized protein
MLLLECGCKPDVRIRREGIFEVTISIREASVGVFVPFLQNLSGLLDKAADYAELRKIDPAILLGMRLYPNMYDLAQQVSEAIRHAVVGPALLAGREPLAFVDSKPDLAELKRRIAAALDFIESLPPAEIDAAADRDVAFRLRSGAELPFTGRSLLLTFAVPQFFFHLTTAYDILRHAGVDLAKKDFLGRR